MKILVTGGTGFLGKYVLRNLLNDGHEVFLISRSLDKKIDKIHYIQGDLKSLEIVKNQSDLSLIKDCEVVFHIGAFYKIDASYSELFLNNVVGTQNIVNLANKLPQLKKFVLVSSIAVLGLDVDHLSENELPFSDKFNDAYSRTKYESEKSFRDFKFNKNVQKIIFRPGIIVGDSISGFREKSDGPYYFIDSFQTNLKLINTIKFLPVPMNPKTKLPIIPVDECAYRMTQLLKRDLLGPILCAHVISDECPDLADFLNDLKDHLKLKVTFKAIKNFQGIEYLFKLIKIPKELIFFMFSTKTYDNHFIKDNGIDVLESKYQDYKASLFK